MPKDISPIIDAKRIVRAAAIKELRYIDKAVVRTRKQQWEIHYTPRSFILTSLNKNNAFENTPSKFDTTVQLIALSVSNNEFDKEDDKNLITKKLLFNKLDTFLTELIQEYLNALPKNFTCNDKSSVFKKRQLSEKKGQYPLEKDLESIAISFYVLLLEKINRLYPSGSHTQSYPYCCYEFFAVHFIQNHINYLSESNESELRVLQSKVLPTVLKLCKHELHIKQQTMVIEVKDAIKNIEIEQKHLISQDKLKKTQNLRSKDKPLGYISLSQSIKNNLCKSSNISFIDLYFELIPIINRYTKCFNVFEVLQKNKLLKPSSPQSLDSEYNFNLLKVMFIKIIDPIIEHYSREPPIYIPTENYFKDEQTPLLIKKYGKRDYKLGDKHTTGCLALLRVIEKFVPSLSEPLGRYCLEKDAIQRRRIDEKVKQLEQEELQREALLERRRKEQQKVQQRLALIEQIRQRREEESLKQAAESAGSYIIVKNDNQNRVAESPEGLLKIKLTIKCLFYDTCRSYFNRYDEKLSRSGFLFWKIKQNPNRNKLIRAAKTWLEQSPSFAKYPVRAFSLMCEQIVAILDKESKRSLLKQDILSLKNNDDLRQLLVRDGSIETIPVEDMFDGDSIKREILIHYHRIQQLDSSKRRDTMDTSPSYANI